MTKTMYVKDRTGLNYLATAIFGKDNLYRFFAVNKNAPLVEYKPKKSFESILMQSFAVGLVLAVTFILLGFDMLFTTLAAVALFGFMIMIQWLVPKFADVVDYQVSGPDVNETPYSRVEERVLQFLLASDKASFERDENVEKFTLLKKAEASYLAGQTFMLNDKELSLIPQFLVRFLTLEAEKFSERKKALDMLAKSEEEKASKDKMQRKLPKDAVKERVMTIQERTPVEPLMKILNAVNAEYRNYEMDIVSILKYPVISDMRFPATKNFIILLSTVESMVPIETEINANSIFATKVHELSYAWDLLKSESRRILLNNYAPEERQRVERAQMFISIALDTAVTPHERQVAYKRVFKELKGVITVPDKAIIALEAKTVLLAIEQLS